jgi:hypothetical protein
MGLIKRKKCRNCKQLFVTDYRNRNRQKYCSKADCRKASKAASQKKWLNKPENKDHFCGPVNVQRVQEWRKQNPGYWKRKRPNQADALQDPLTGQLIENTHDNRQIATSALQDFLKKQPAVIIGLISNFIGSALQDDIAATLFRMQQSGQDILYCQLKEKGGKHDCKIPDFAQKSTQNPKKFQLDRSPAGQ